MLAREFTINVGDPESIQKTADEIRAFSENLENKAHEICRRLAEIGLRVAEINYAGGAIDGNSDVSVSVRPIPNGYSIVASGEDVFFLEFGTGVAAGLMNDPSVITPPVSTEPGSWSETHGRQFSEKGYWYYNGIKYEMTTPRMGMYLAAKEIEQRIQSVAEEVFK